jgi:hypothetical protein
MTTKLTKSRAQISGECTVEEAEEIFAWLTRSDKGVIYFNGAVTLHAAALQAVMAARPVVGRLSDDPFTAECLRQAILSHQEQIS